MTCARAIVDAMLSESDDMDINDFMRGHDTAARSYEGYTYYIPGHLFWRGVTDVDGMTAEQMPSVIEAITQWVNQQFPGLSVEVGPRLQATSYVAGPDRETEEQIDNWITSNWIELQHYLRAKLT
jgi:hypothetical protein